MASISAFERMAIAEAKVSTLSQTVRKQAADIQVLQAQISVLMSRASGPVELAKPIAGMRDIAAMVAAENMLTLADIRGPKRERRISHPRQVAMARMLDEGYSTTQVGDFLGGRDHTTVIEGARRARERGQV